MTTQQNIFLMVVVVGVGEINVIFKLFFFSFRYRDLCEQLLCLMKPSEQKKTGAHKVLDAPINLAQMAANAETQSTDVTSIWVINRDDNLVILIKFSLFILLFSPVIALTFGLDFVF